MLLSLGLMVLGAAHAQDLEVPSEPPDPEVESPAEAPAEDATGVTFEVGRITFEATREREVPELVFDACAASAPPPTRDVGPTDGQVTLQLTFRRGKLALVSATRVDTGLSWATPCLKRELAAVDWPIRKGTAELPITIHRPAP